MKKSQHESQDVLARAASVHEELVGIVQGGWVGILDGEDFVLQGEKDLHEGKLCIRVTGHRSLTDPQWRSWVIGSLLRAGALQDVAEKIWSAGVFLPDMTSFGSLGRATKPYAAATVMFMDDLLLQVENMSLQPETASSFQKRIAGKNFTSLDLFQMLRNAQPVAGKGIAQTGGDFLYRDQNVTGYGVGR